MGFVHGEEVLSSLPVPSSSHHLLQKLKTHHLLHTNHQRLRKSHPTLPSSHQTPSTIMRSTSLITAFALVAAVVASPTPQPQRGSNSAPGSPVDPGVRVPKGTFCTTTNDPDVIGCNTGDGGTFNVINGKISGCAGCTPENGFGK